MDTLKGMNVALGFDLGGTKMLCGALALAEGAQGAVESGPGETGGQQSVPRTSGEVIATEKKKTRNNGDPENLVERMVKCVKGCLDEADVSRSDVSVLGVAAPGPIDAENGILLETPNLGVREFPLAGELEKRLGFPVVLENDVNAGLYGEFTHGAAQRFRDVVGLFPGTGVGGAMVLGGELYRGSRGGAGEIGHIIVEPGGRICGCGHRGCLEAVASRGAIAREAALLVGAGRAPTIAAAAGSDISRMKSGVFLDAVEAGETSVIEIIERAGWWLGVGMAACVNIFNPEAIVVGGGLVEKLGDHYLAPAERSMREHAMEFLVASVEVAAATLADNAAVIGAAELALRACGEAARS